MSVKKLFLLAIVLLLLVLAFPAHHNRQFELEASSAPIRAAAATELLESLVPAAKQDNEPTRNHETRASIRRNSTPELEDKARVDELLKRIDQLERENTAIESRRQRESDEQTERLSRRAFETSAFERSMKELERENELFRKFVAAPDKSFLSITSELLGSRFDRPRRKDDDCLRLKLTAISLKNLDIPTLRLHFRGNMIPTTGEPFEVTLFLERGEKLITEYRAVSVTPTERKDWLAAFRPNLVLRPGETVSLVVRVNSLSFGNTPDIDGVMIDILYSDDIQYLVDGQVQTGRSYSGLSFFYE